MKRLSIILLLSLSAWVAHATEVLSFHYQLLGDPAVRLVWEMDNTNGILGFEVERSTDNSHFTSVSSSIFCNGELDYEFTDYPGQGLNSLNLGDKGHRTDIEQTYYYRLVYLLPNQGRQVSSAPALEVDLQLNTVSTTWGDIKAMFR